MRTVRAVVVAHDEPGHLAIRQVPAPSPAPSQALIRVAAISLNPGEIRNLRHASAGFRPGWDFAGTVVKGAADGSTPPPGTRVVGVLPMGAWCEEVAAPHAAFAVLPNGVDLRRAAAVPVAGLTAFHALRRNDAARKVLITGASGGVGIFALQLARHAGATVTALIRDTAHEALVRRLGAHNVVGAVDAARKFGPFDLVLELIGADVLGAALTMLTPAGTCVILGATAGSVTTFDASLFRAGGTSLYGLVLGHELRREPPCVGLEQLVTLIGDGALAPVVGASAPWEHVGRVAVDLTARRFAGKAILRVTEEQ